MHRLRGEFAFAIWDERDGLLFAGRDRFGIKPLYYALQDGACHVASEIKALPELGVALRWDRETVFDMHRGVAMHPPARDGLRRSPPGAARPLPDHRRRERARRSRTGTGTTPPRTAPGSTATRTTGSSELQGTLEEAVRLRLRADVPVACYLSGGLDSCAVLGLASRLSSRPLRAYTLSFDMADYDERALAEEQAKLSGAEFCPIDIRAEHMADHLADAVYHAERPIVNAHVVAKYLLSRAVRDSGVKVVLTGEGSDEVLRRLSLLPPGHDPATTRRARTPRPRRALLARLDAANKVSQGLLLPSGTGGANESVRRMLGFVPTIVETWDQQGALAVGAPRRRLRGARSRGRDPFRVLLSQLDVERQLAGRDPVNQSLYIWAKTMLPNYILSNLGDRMEMAHSVEGRLPFLDHHVVEPRSRACRSR